MTTRTLSPMAYTVNPDGVTSQDITKVGFPTVLPMYKDVNAMLAALNPRLGDGTIDPANYCATFIDMSAAGARGLVLGLHSLGVDGETCNERAYLVSPTLFSGVPAIEVRQVVSASTWTIGSNAVGAALGAASPASKIMRNLAFTSSGWLEAMAFVGPAAYDGNPAAYTVPLVPDAAGYLRIISKVTGTSYRPTHGKYGLG